MGAVIAPAWANNSRMDVSYRSAAEPLASPSGNPLPSPSIAGSFTQSRNRSKRLSKRSLDHRGLPSFDQQEVTSSIKKGSEIRGRPSTTRVMNNPALAGGSTNYPVKMDHEFDQFWPDLGRTMNADEVDVDFLTTPDGRGGLNSQKESQDEFVKDVPVQISFEPQESQRVTSENK